jgi:hypothetical protein
MHPPFFWVDITNIILGLASTRVQTIETQALFSSLLLLLACVFGVAVCVAIAVVIIRRR